MKLYTIAGGQLSPGWTVTTTVGTPAVSLGEEGRGRTLTRCPLTEPLPPCPRGEGPQYFVGTGAVPKVCVCGCRLDYPAYPAPSEAPHPATGQPAHVRRHHVEAEERLMAGQLFRAGHVLQVAPGDATDASPLLGVLVRNHAGFRGSWTLKGQRTGDCHGSLRPTLRTAGDPSSAWDIQDCTTAAVAAARSVEQHEQDRQTALLAYWSAQPALTLEAKVASVTNVRGETTTETVQPTLLWTSEGLVYREPHPRTGDIRYSEMFAQFTLSGWEAPGLRWCHGRDHRAYRYFRSALEAAMAHYQAMPAPPAAPEPVAQFPDLSDRPDQWSRSQTAYCAGCARTVGGWDGLQYADPPSHGPDRPVAQRHGVFADPPRVLAQGVCADGIAGRVGGGPEVIVVLQPGEGFSISRSGRLYGGASLLLVEHTGPQGLRVETLAEQDIRLANTRPVEEAWK